MKYNTILRVGSFEDETGKSWTSISFVSTDHQEHEVLVETNLLTTAGNYSPIPAEYFTHPACCEHPKGCPDETNTERLIKEFNNAKVV